MGEAVFMKPLCAAPAFSRDIACGERNHVSMQRMASQSEINIYEAGGLQITDF